MIIYYILEKVHFFCAKIKKIVDVRKIIVYYTIKHIKNVPISNLSHFQSIHGGGFFRKEQIYEQTTRLSGYVRTDSATDGGQTKNFFAVIQQQRIR